MEYVLSHGDFIHSNILVDGDGIPWFIDFEYCIAAPKYYDIGKFFRTKDKFKEYINDKVYENFEKGYNSRADNYLPENWVLLSKIGDIPSMLQLINRDKIPEGWATAVDSEINRDLDMLAEY